MTGLTALFGSSPEPDDEAEPQSDKLLNLYWNRAELKKEFASLREENYQLQDRVKEQQGATARLEQKLEHLENLLLDPEWVYTVCVYYQLRALNFRCRSRLAKFAEELKQQREKKQQSQLLDEWNEQRELEGRAIQSEIGSQRMQVQLLEDQLQAEQHRLATMNSFVKFFRRGSMMAALDELSARIQSAQEEERDLLMRFDEIQQREPPDTKGLNIATKRMINFMILAFGQQLYLHFRDDNLAFLAKEAGDKSVGAVSYGGKEDCDVILARVAKRLARLENTSEFADVLRNRSRLIAEKAMFPHDDEAVPTSRTVATVYEIASSGKVLEEEVNLLGENYWNLANVISR